MSSTIETLIPQASVCSSRIRRMSALSFRALQHLVEVVLAEHGSKRGLRELAGRFREVLDLMIAFSGSITR